MELPPKTSLDRGHKFCGMELEHAKRFLGLSRHFTVMSTIALLVAIVGLISLLTDASIFKFSFQWSLISVCHLVLVKCLKASRLFVFTLHFV
jgi:hypothetical protein